MSNEDQKKASAEAALKLVEPGSILGVGTGSTVTWFIRALGRSGLKLAGAVSSSEATTRMLKEIGVEVMDLNHTGDLGLYVDGADECDPHRRLIKGGGGALTREKIIAAASRRFVCMIDGTKRVDVLGRFPLPIEVVPMARSYVARQLVARGGRPVLREGFVTDNGNAILDVHGLKILDPVALESELNQIPGVVTVGLFARRGADVVICDGRTL
ncbi:MAG: ribose-5-phosphate isomerase RpiA [Xanthomonadales bacterium]|jgi:ribose 5-phosphate isomerase A|nr:ribose-5-phosphate isomerase RpiA [Xanthomonadales bacterium]